MPFKPIQLGHLHLASNIVQGPLAGYSSAPLRSLIWRYGGVGYCTTEMISALDLCHRKQKPKRYLARAENEKILCYQLSGNDPELLGQAANIVSDLGADIIDLNCGCPVNKIRKKNCGSKLLTQPEIIYQNIKAIKANSNAVVSLKVRIAKPVHDHDDKRVVDAAEAAGVDFLIVHGRHWTERYDIPCRQEVIREIVDYANVPVFANGDADDTKSLTTLMDNTGCAGVMIARASVGQPWLFQQIKAELAGESFVKPRFNEIGNLFLEHIRMLIELDSPKLGVLQARKLAKYYGRGLAQRDAFTQAIQKATSYQQLEKIIKIYTE